MALKRIKWLDFAKGTAIFWVIYMHSMDNVLYSNNIPLALLLKDILSIIAMPLFFVISGYLYKPTTNKYKFILMIYKKSTSFIIPYLVFSIIAIIIHMNDFYNPIECILLPLSYLWFFYSLFIIFIIFGIMDLFKFNFKIEIVISVICLILSLFMKEKFIIPVIPNPIKNTFGFIIFFELGVLIKKFNILKMLKNNDIFFGLSVIWIIILIIHFLKFGLWPDTNFIYFNDILSKIVGIFLFFSVFMKWPHNLLFNYFDKYGKYTLVIYLMQSPVITIVYKHVLLRLFKTFCIYHSFLMVLILIFISWYLCIITCYLLRFHVIHDIFYPRKYINKLVSKTEFGKKYVIKQRPYYDK